MFLLYIDILTEPSFIFEKPILTDIKKDFPMIETCDLDNFSENFLFDYTLTAFQKTENNILFFNVQDSEASLGKAILLLNKLIKKKQEITIFMKGNHTMLEKMLKIYPHTHFNCQKDGIYKIISKLSASK